MNTLADHPDDVAPRARRVLAPHVDEIEAAADAAANLADEDVYRVLAAIGQGKPVPGGAARRIVDRGAEG